MSLVVEGICKAIGGLHILQDVSLSVPEGGLVGLIGPNGAGKSTLFAVVTGFMAADKGAVSLGAQPIDALPPQARAGHGLMRTFQVPRPFAHLSVRENLAAAAPGQVGESIASLFFRRARVRSQEAEILRQVDETLSFLNLAAVADLPAGRLSGGQRKLLELGRVLMTDPRIVLLDEPFAGVNPVLCEEIGRRILDLNARGIAFLIIEHNLQALARLVPRLYVMDRGRVIAEGDAQVVLGDPEVQQAYVGGVL